MSPKLVAVLCVIGGVAVTVGQPALANFGSVGAEAAPCLRRHNLPAFTAYSLGSSFAGLPRVEMFRSCYAPPRGRRLIGGPRSVTWTTDAIYGTCTPEGPERTCDPPLEIESWPECDRNFGSYRTAKSPSALRPSTFFRLSGSYKIPTVALESGLSNRIEMYTGQTTIVIFGMGPNGESLARRAAHALAHIIAPKVSSISPARLRAAAVSTRGCGSR